MKHCPECGTKFSEQVKWPRQCWNGECNFIAWKSHGLVPVGLILCFKDTLIDTVNYARDSVGILVGRRGIEPKLGEFALTGGFPEPGETWQEALVRECREEVGLEYDVEEVRLYDAVTVENDRTLLFSVLPAIISEEELLKRFVPNKEVTEIKVIYKPETLGFGSHTQMVERYFSEARGLFDED